MTRSEFNPNTLYGRFFDYLLEKDITIFYTRTAMAWYKQNANTGRAHYSGLFSSVLAPLIHFGLIQKSTRGEYHVHIPETEEDQADREALRCSTERDFYLLAQEKQHCLDSEELEEFRTKFGREPYKEVIV